METINEVGCGVADHAPECLCDVDMSRATNTWVFDGVHGMSFGYEIAEYRGYCHPWTSEKFADYLQDLALLHDSIAGLPSGVSDWHEPDEIRYGDNVHCWSDIRRSVLLAVSRSGDGDVVSAVRSIGVTPEQFMRAVTTNRAPDVWLSSWDEGKLSEFQEDYLRSGSPRRVLLAKYGFPSVSTYKTLVRYFAPSDSNLVFRDPADNKLAPVRIKAREVARDLMRTTDMTNSEIIKKIHEDYGYLYGRSSIAKIRQRMRLKGEDNSGA